MKNFMDENFLLETKTAISLYNNYAKDLPIIDYHCHVSPYEINDNLRFDSITQVWLGGDHYKWRAMRAMGVSEDFITGNATDREKFRAWAKTIPMLIGNPLYHWTHLELQRYFGVMEPLCEENADKIFDHCNEILQRDDMRVRGIIQKSNVEVVCTTDDPIDKLDAHHALASDENAPSKVLPAFRPDKAMNINKETFAGYIKTLEELCDIKINTVEDLKKALKDRLDYFDKHNCSVSDHALDKLIYAEASTEELNKALLDAKVGIVPNAHLTEAFQTTILEFLAKEYHDRNWVMQLHFGCLRNNSAKMFKRLGADTGYDAMNSVSDPQKLISFLSKLEEAGKLPKTILYSLNPTENEVLLTVMGCFQTDGGVGKIQLGSAWWFNDHLIGMEKQMKDLASIGVLGAFIGMLTDSRSFLSYTRHEYFRRIVCNMIGNFVESGQYPNDEKMLKTLVEGICYKNAKDYFNF
ncbi:MAG: glucuronate isomerase [Defluviitaleaceae bacterium]|nr:glucuronate isomerase [Defluviitaleaceae bacterium]